MHTLQLKIDDSIFDKFMGLLDILPKEKISVVEEQVVTSKEEVQKRVYAAESNASYVAEEQFWDEIDKNIEKM